MGKRKNSKAQQEIVPTVEEVEETTMNNVDEESVETSAAEVAQAEDVSLDNEILFENAEEAEAASPDSSVEADDSESEEDLEVSEGGTKERKKRGKRQIIFTCAANVEIVEENLEQGEIAGEMKLVLEEIAVSMPADDQTFDPAKGRIEASEIFENKYGVKPAIKGPYYIRKGIAAQPRKRETINVTVAKEAEFTAERGSAVHRFKDLDWKVIVNFTTKPDTVWVFYDTLVDPKQAPKDKTKFQKPTPKFLPISSLRDVQKNA